MSVARIFMGLARGGAPPLNTLWTWGLNTSGQLGDGTVAAKSSPIQVGALTDWSDVGTGAAMCVGVKTDGTLWSWGYNRDGQLGQGTSGNSISSPIQVGALTDWGSNIACGSTHTVVVKTDGTLWAWGDNTFGQLGDGTRTTRISPVKIGALTTWSSVGTCIESTLAIKTDGTLWTWGNNANGELGDGTVAKKSSPIQVGALTDWSNIAGGSTNAAAIKTDGTLWAWGDNTFGQLGDGTVAKKSSPIQVGALTDWSNVSIGNRSTAAIKTDDTLWTWGASDSGQLGDGQASVNKSSPIQVGALTDWSIVKSGVAFTGSIKTDGTLWTWGYNANGQLGDGTRTLKSSPVKIGALTNWGTLRMSSEADHTVAIKG